MTEYIVQVQRQDGTPFNSVKYVEELIRCKDCKYSKHWYRDKRLCFLWNEDGIDVFESGYCNYGGREE